MNTVKKWKQTIYPESGNDQHQQFQEEKVDSHRPIIVLSLIFPLPALLHSSISEFPDGCWVQ